MGYALSISVQTRDISDREAVFRQVSAAEDGGVEAAWVAESWGQDAFTLMTQMADRTKRLKIGSGIVNIFSRSPGALAQQFGTLDVVSGGRMIIGLGTSGANVIEDFHGMPFAQPLQRLREYVEIINMLIAGQPLHYEGEIYSMSRGFTLRFERERDHIPIYLATLAPKGVRMAAEVADGWLPTWTPVEKLADMSAAIRQHSQAAGRSEDAVTIRSSGGVVFTRDVERARQGVAGTFAFYVARMGEFYYRHLSRLGYGQVADDIRKAWGEGGSAAGAAAVPADLQQSVTLVTDSLDAARERFAQEDEAGVRLHSLSVEADDPREVERVYSALAG